jgi:hypothetical protein
MDLKEVVSEVGGDETGSGSCVVADSVINGVENSCRTARRVIIFN